MIPNTMPSDDSEIPAEIPEELRASIERLRSVMDDFIETQRDQNEPSEEPLAPSLTSEPEVVSSVPVDRRLYLPLADGWEVQIQSGPPDRCHRQNPGEDWFHLLVSGEIFVASGSTKLCLNCALRQGVLTDDRLFWQHGHRQRIDIHEHDGEP